MDVFEDRSFVKFSVISHVPDVVIPVCNAADDEHELNLSSDYNKHTTISDTKYSAVRSCQNGVERNLEVRRSVVSFHGDIHTKRLVAESVSVKDNLANTVACFVMTNYDPALIPMPQSTNTSALEAPTLKPPGVVAHVFGLETDLIGYSTQNILGYTQLHTSLPLHTATIAQGMGCLKSIAKQASRCSRESIMARAFEVCRSDPYLATAAVHVVTCVPGLRVLHFTLNADNNAITDRHACVVLSAVKECDDLDMVTQAKVFHARSSNSVRPSGNTSKNTPSAPNLTAPINIPGVNIPGVNIPGINIPGVNALAMNLKTVRKSAALKAPITRMPLPKPPVTTPSVIKAPVTKPPVTKPVAMKTFSSSVDQTKTLENSRKSAAKVTANVTANVTAKVTPVSSVHPSDTDMFWHLSGTFNPVQLMIHEAVFHV
jgi:hypothetical protein